MEDGQDNHASLCLRDLFSKLPAELTEHILTNLHPVQILGAKFVCRAWRDLIRSSPQLQYSTECFTVDVFSGTNDLDTSLSGRLTSIKQWRKAWKDLRWSKRYDITFPCPELNEEDDSSMIVQGTSLCAFKEDPETGGEFSFYVLDSKLRGTEAKRWTLSHILNGKPGCPEWTYSLEEDLLAVLKSEATADHYDLSFYSCATGQPHPEAVSIHVPSIGTTVGPEDNRAYDLNTSGYTTGRKGSYYCIYPQAKRMSSCPTTCHFSARESSFSPSTVVIPTNQPTATIFAAELCNLPRNKCNIKDILLFHPAMVLDIPLIIEGMAYEDIAIRCTPVCSKPSGDGIFSMRRSNAVIVLRLFLEGEDDLDNEGLSDLVVSPTFIFAKLPGLAKTPLNENGNNILLWEGWGAYTRIFGASHIPEKDLQGSWYLTTKELADGQHQVTVLDFDVTPALALDSMYVNPEAVVIKTTQNDQKPRCNEVVGTHGCVPCREIVSDIVVGIDDYVYLAEDGIIVARKGETQTDVYNARLEVYSI